MIQACLIYLLSFYLSLSSDHDIHVSVLEIDLEEQKIELTLKTFLDDLQIAVGLTPGEEVPSDYTSAEELISEYVMTSVQLAIDGQQLELLEEDISASTEAVWITYKAKVDKKDPSNIVLNSTFLTEVYDDQTNLVNINHAGSKKSFILNQKKKRVAHDFK